MSVNLEQILRIYQAGKFIGALIVRGFATAQKLKATFELTPDFEVNIQTLSDRAIDADEETIREANEWRAEKGLPPLEAPGSPTGPIAPAAPTDADE